MKRKKKKSMIENGKVVYTDYLYNFNTLREAEIRLHEIKSRCVYPIVKDKKRSFICDKGYTQLEFTII